MSANYQTTINNNVSQGCKVNTSATVEQVIIDAVNSKLGDISILNYNQSNPNCQFRNYVANSAKNQTKAYQII